MLCELSDQSIICFSPQNEKKVVCPEQLLHPRCFMGIFAPQASQQNLLGDLCLILLALTHKLGNCTDLYVMFPRVKWGWLSCQEDTISAKGLAHRHPGVAYHQKLALIAQLESDSAGTGARSPASKAHILSSTSRLSLCKHYCLCDTKYLRNPLMVIQIRDSSGLLVFCSECSPIIRKPMSLVTSENFY